MNRQYEQQYNTSLNINDMFKRMNAMESRITDLEIKNRNLTTNDLLQYSN